MDQTLSNVLMARRSQPSVPQIPVGIIEPHDIYRTGLHVRIQHESDLHVVYSHEQWPAVRADTNAAAVTVVSARLVPPRVSKRLNTADARPLPPCWIITPVDPMRWDGRSGVPGEVCYAERSCAGLITAIRRVAAAAPWPVDTTLAAVMDAWRADDHAIAQGVAQGRSTREIARQVYLSESAVKKRIKSLLTAIDGHGRAELAAVYTRYAASRLGEDSATVVQKPAARETRHPANLPDRAL